MIHLKITKKQAYQLMKRLFDVFLNVVNVLNMSFERYEYLRDVS